LPWKQQLQHPQLVTYIPTKLYKRFVLELAYPTSDDEDDKMMMMMMMMRW